MAGAREATPEPGDEDDEMPDEDGVLPDVEPADRKGRGRPAIAAVRAAKGGDSD